MSLIPDATAAAWGVFFLLRMPMQSLTSDGMGFYPAKDAAEKAMHCVGRIG